MSYRLDLERPVPDALRAVAVERLEKATGRLSREHAEDPVEAVHGARKDLKKARSLLRLARPGMPEKAYRRENRRLRDIGRSMSAGRDAVVMVETVEGLAAHADGRVPKRQLSTLGRRLAASAQGEDAYAPAISARLAKATAKAAEWPLDGCDAGTLVAGAGRAYARGRKALAAAERDRGAEALHEWRKRVKDLWYHQRLLRDAWPGPIKAYADECDRLSDLLGDEHDLATLDAVLRGGFAAPPSVDLEAVLALIAARRAELQEQAFQLGARVFADKPKAYARRLGRCLTAKGVETRRPQPA